MADEPTDPPAPAVPSDPPPPWKGPESQAELDRIIQDRLSRERAKFADYDDLKTKASRLDEIEAANQTELEKAQRAAEEATQRATQLEQQYRAATVRSAVQAAAMKAGAVDPDAVLALLPSDAVTIGDDGQVTGADEAVGALLEAKPFLKGQAAPSFPPVPQGQQGKAGSITRDDLKRMSPEAIERARAAGELDHLLNPT